MKRLLVILSILLFAGNSEAGKTVNQKLLTVSGTAIVNLALTNQIDVTTDSIKNTGNTGFMTIFLTEDKAGGAGDVDIYAQYSYDGTSWARPRTSNMSGTLTQEGLIAEAFGNLSNIPIVFTVRMAPYVRFIFSPDADSEITASAVYQEEF